ncbi:MAG: glycosyl hydrolase family 65 protein, partial [Ilumatobacteraceae bacterium]
AFGVETTVGPDQSKTVISGRLQAGQTLRIVKFVAYHTSTGVPAEELADRCHRTLVRAMDDGHDAIVGEQRAWLERFWADSDIELRGDDAAQQAVRWNLFQLAQASAQTQEHGIAAKGVTGGGYEGHYFWDTETYVVPFLAYTSPETARKLLRFRWRQLDKARDRAVELNQVGAMYPWRTINGDEASAYYAAGTAQYHINAAIAFALKRYLDASGDVAFLAGEAAEIFVETARLWEDLGFYSTNGKEAFRIHGVTGPDEYTTVVNDNLYTNVMARFNMRYAARIVDLLEAWDSDAYASLCRRLRLQPGETAAWTRAAESMYLPYDEELGIHPQDDRFLECEPWDFAGTPAEKYPLLLHFHPLVIYRHQVLKQADVVLAMVLREDQFSLDQKRRNFDYYDPITTGDSSLSACVQAMAAAQIGYDELAMEYFREALFVDLADTHGNANDGVHVASAGGVWGTIVFGFAGLHDHGTALRFSPSLPSVWQGVTFRMQRHGSRMTVELDADGCTVTVIDGPPVPIEVRDGATVTIARVPAGSSHRVPRSAAAGASPG